MSCATLQIMAKYTGQILKATTSTTVGVGALSISTTGSAQTHRAKLLEFFCGSDAATLGTSNFRWEIQRSTTTATGTAAGVNALDPSDSTVNWDLKSNLSANGTLTANAIMMTIAIAEQATFRYVANPGSEIVIPGTPSNGLHFMTPVCGNTPSAAAQILFEEL